MDIEFTRYNIKPETKVLKVTVFKEDLDFPQKQKPKEVFLTFEISNGDGSPEVQPVMEIVKRHKDKLKGQKLIFVFVEGV